MNNVTIFNLCCGGRRCPEVSVSNDEWIIKDDFGGSVKLTKNQIAELIQHPTALSLLND